MGVLTLHSPTPFVIVQNQPGARLSAAALETDPIIVVALIVVLIVVLLLFWRMTRKPGPAPTEDLESATASTQAAPPAAVSTVATLEFVDAASQPVIFKLDKSALTLGRASDNDLVIADPIVQAASVSKHHARLRRDQEEYIVRDLGSKNGVTVNGRHTIENVLQDGDRIGLGAAEAVFRKGNGGTA